MRDGALRIHQPKGVTMTMTTEAPKKRSLFTIGEDLLAIEQIIEQAEGDISDPAVEATITSWLQELATDQANKADGYVNLIKKWEGEKAAAKAEAEQYTKAANVRAARIERLKLLLKQHMEATHQQKIETATGRTIAIQKNGGLCPLQVDAALNPAAIDAKFQKVTIELNSDAVRTALDAGEKLAFARLGLRGTSLRIK
jgi:hypothetical protein